MILLAAVSYHGVWTIWRRVPELGTGAVPAKFADGEADCCPLPVAVNLVGGGDAGGHLHFHCLEEPKPGCA